MTGRSSATSASRPGLGRRLSGFVFGDRCGLAVFLGTVCVVSAYWRAGVFITDTETLVVTLEALSSGRLWIDHVSDSHFAGPGAVVADGLVYGRNYGQVVLALPFLWAIEGLDRLADLRVGLAALWHLALLWFVVQLARLRDAGSTVVIVGCIAVLGSFLLNLSLATSFLDPRPALLALQVQTIVATGLLAVVVYRLVARRYGARTGVLTGGGVALVLPIGFWAGLPKRHVLVALLLSVTLYSFARSRDAEVMVDLPVIGPFPAFRSIPYAMVGLLAWIHAVESVFVLLSLLAVDLPTAPSNDRRVLVALAGVLLVSLLPAFVTNVLISGNPLGTPRTLVPAKGVELSDTGGAVGGERGFSAADFDAPGIFDVLPGPLSIIPSVAYDGLRALSEPTRVYHTWIRSGASGVVASHQPEFDGTNLTVLESVPLFGAFAVLLAMAGRLGRAEYKRAVGRIEPTDWLAVALVVPFVLIYAPRLPLQVQVTARYLLPTFPLALYLLVRVAPVRRVLDERPQTVFFSYAGGVLVGSQLLLAFVLVESLTVNGALQTHALLGLAVALALALGIGASRLDDRALSASAVALGLAAAAGTAFVLLTGFAYFSFVGEYVLPFAQVVSDAIGRI